MSDDKRPLYLDAWQLGLSPTADKLAVRIEAYQGLSSGWCTASNATLAKELGGVRGETVRHGLAELRRAGCLQEQTRTGHVSRRRLVRPTPRATAPGSGSTGGAVAPPTPPAAAHTPPPLLTPQGGRGGSEEDPEARARRDRKARIQREGGL